MIVHQSTPTTLVPDWNNLFLIMSGKGVAIDKQIAATVAYLKRCPASKVPEAMRCANSPIRRVATLQSKWQSAKRTRRP